MASKRKNILKAAKQQVKDRRGKMLNEMSCLIKDREKLEDRSSEEYIALSDNISELFNQIKQLDNVVSRKDKKSKNIIWRDSDYTPAMPSKSSNATIVDKEAYANASEKSLNIRTGPVAKWLVPGILVKKRGSEMVGLVMDTKPGYSTVLFGGCETIARNLSLRPADWED